VFWQLGRLNNSWVGRRSAVTRRCVVLCVSAELQRLLMPSRRPKPLIQRQSVTSHRTLTSDTLRKSQIPKSWIKDKHQAQYSERKGVNGDVITRTDWNETCQRLGGTHYSSNLKKSPAKGPLCWDWESQWEIYKRGALLFILWRCRYHSRRCRQYGGSCVMIWDHTDEWHHLVFRW
jgi:hypothetical protein